MHRVKRLVPFALAAAAFGGLTATASAAESLTLDLSDPKNADPNPAGAPVFSSVLAAGTKYVVVVTGTGSIWEPKAWNKRGQCGAPDAAPVFLSPGKNPNAVAAWDAATVYGAPAGADIGPFGQACTPAVSLPMSTISGTGNGRTTAAGFEMTSGTEGRYARPTPYGGIRTAPRADRTYFFPVTGAGKPLGFRFADGPSTDNSGVFAISVLTEAECAEKACLARAGAEFDQVPPPAGSYTGATDNANLTPGASTPGTGANGGSGGAVTPITVPSASKNAVGVSGTRTCKRTPTITVQLAEPNGVDFRKVTYFFSGQKKRVLYRTTKKASRVLIYTAGKKKGQIKPQKFTGLSIKRQYRLTLQITTTANQSVTVSRTIRACTKTKKTRRFS